MGKSTNSTEQDDYRLTVRDILSERMYWIKRRVGMTARSALYKVMPRWLVREAFMYSQRYIKDAEIVPDVTFMTVFKRVCDNDLAERHSGTRVTS